MATKNSLKMLSGFDPHNAKVLWNFIQKHRDGKNRKIAVFDADGTLWRGDVGEAFFRDQAQKKQVPRAPKGDAWQVYLKESTRGDTAKAYGWLAQWNAGVTERQLKQWCREFFDSQWTANVFEPMRELIAELNHAGFEIWVITGSIRWIVQAGITSFTGIDPDRVLGSSVEVKDGVLTDRIEDVIPYRTGKWELINKRIGVRPLFVAGNSFWDKEMMDAATELALAVHSENPGEPNHDSEQKLKAHAHGLDWLVQRF